MPKRKAKANNGSAGKSRMKSNSNASSSNSATFSPSQLKIGLLEGTDIYDAERIVESRYRNGRSEFLVKWRGWPSRYNTWEPEDHIIEKKLFEDFVTEQAKRKAKLQSQPSTSRAFLNSSGSRSSRGTGGGTRSGRRDGRKPPSSSSSSLSSTSSSSFSLQHFNDSTNSNHVAGGRTRSSRS